MLQPHFAMFSGLSTFAPFFGSPLMPRPVLEPIDSLQCQHASQEPRRDLKMTTRPARASHPYPDENEAATARTSMYHPKSKSGDRGTRLAEATICRGRSHLPKWTSSSASPTVPHRTVGARLRSLSTENEQMIENSGKIYTGYSELSCRGRGGESSGSRS